MAGKTKKRKRRASSRRIMRRAKRWGISGRGMSARAMLATKKASGKIGGRYAGMEKPYSVYLRTGVAPKRRGSVSTRMKRTLRGR